MRAAGDGLSPEVAAWVRHYSSGFFCRAHLTARLEEVQQLTPHQQYHKDYPHRHAISAALCHILSQPGTQLSIFTE
jgi:hypothetical protein